MDKYDYAKALFIANFANDKYFNDMLSNTCAEAGVAALKVGEGKGLKNIMIQGAEKALQELPILIEKLKQL